MKKTLIAILLLLCLAGMITGCIKIDISAPDTVKYDNADQYTVGTGSVDASVTALDIGWFAGSVSVVYGDTDKIVFSEDAADGPAMAYWLDGKTLRLQFCESGLQVGKSKKALTVTVPQSTALKEVDISAVSADVTVSVTVGDELEIETVSGKSNVTLADKLAEAEFKTVSGTVALTGTSVGEISFESISADMTLTLAKRPGSLKADTVSGNITLNVPASFEPFDFRFGSISGDAQSDTPFTKTDDVWHLKANEASGDVPCYAIHTVSGDFTVKAE